MSDFSLYKYCLRKVSILVRDRFYKSSHENPFSSVPSNIVNDLMSTALDGHNSNGWRAEDFQQLLNSGRLRELRINGQNLNTDQSDILRQVLYFFKSGYQVLEALHLTGLIHYQVENPKQPRSDVSELLGSLLRNAPNLKEFHCCFSFDLKALRNCKKLREVRLHFWPQQHWYKFLAKEDGNFQPHKYLKFFTVCHTPEQALIPSDDIVVILRHCPELTSLGYIESSRALSLLYRMGIPLSEFKLQQCYWGDIDISSWNKLWSERERGLDRIVRDAMLNFSKIEELDFLASSVKRISYLRKLKNLVYLNITSNSEENLNAVFDQVFQEIGSRLKHLSFKVVSPVDITIFLQYCPNLESLRISGYIDSLYASSVIHLPRLRRLTLKNCRNNDVRQIFSLLSGSNQLTDLFLVGFTGFDDESLYQFLKKNSFSNLKVAYLKYCSLTELGFREFLRNALQLEIVEIYDDNLSGSLFERVVRDTKHKAICNEDTLSEKSEFFEKRRAFFCCD